MGINDDESYIASALSLAKTGRIHYNGWSAAILGWQLYLGALFIRLFGFSFTIVRASVLLVAVACVILLHLIFVRFGLSRVNAIYATLTVALSPLFLSLSFSFMSDIPGLFAILLCLYLCLRADQAITDQNSALWLIAAALANALTGTVRQISWLGLLVMVPAVAWHLRARRRVLLAAVFSCFVGAAFLFACMHWFKLQPYSISEPLLPVKDGAGEGRNAVQRIRAFASAVVTLTLFCVPVLAAFLAKIRLLPALRRRQAAVLLGLCVLITAYEISRRMTPLGTPFLGNIVGSGGVPNVYTLPGSQPQVFTYAVRALLNFAILISAAAAFLCWQSRRVISSAKRSEPVPTRTFFYLLAPFTGAYILLTITRLALFDRYLLTLIIVAVLCIVRFYQRLFGDLPMLTPLVLAISAFVSVAAVHDGFVYQRAHLAAIQELRASGIPRDQIRGGFEYDAWTQIEDAGFIADVRFPSLAAGYQPPSASTVPPECRFVFADRTPSIAGEFGITYSPLSCYRQAQFPPVTYNTWLPPRERKLFIEQLR